MFTFSLLLVDRLQRCQVLCKYLASLIVSLFVTLETMSWSAEISSHKNSEWSYYPDMIKPCNQKRSRQTDLFIDEPAIFGKNKAHSIHMLSSFFGIEMYF